MRDIKVAPVSVSEIRHNTGFEDCEDYEMSDCWINQSESRIP